MQTCCAVIDWTNCSKLKSIHPITYIHTLMVGDTQCQHWLDPLVDRKQTRTSSTRTDRHLLSFNQLVSFNFIFCVSMLVCGDCNLHPWLSSHDLKPVAVLSFLSRLDQRSFQECSKITNWHCTIREMFPFSEQERNGQHCETNVGAASQFELLGSGKHLTLFHLVPRQCQSRWPLVCSTVHNPSHSDKTPLYPCSLFAESIEWASYWSTHLIIQTGCSRYLSSKLG